MTDDKPPTHTAYALKREGKRGGRWFEIGHARQEDNGVIHVVLELTPWGGFNGYLYVTPIGTKPPGAKPHHPNEPSEREDF